MKIKKENQTRNANKNSWFIKCIARWFTRTNASRWRWTTKKEINDLLNPNELKNLRVVINNIDEKNIYCSFLELNYNFSLNKSHIVSTINALNKTMEDKKKNIFQEYLKYLILPLVLVFIIGGAFGYLKVKQGNYKNDIAEIKQK